MKKILFSLAVIGIVSVVTVGGTLALDLFSAEDTQIITMGSGTVTLGTVSVAPTTIEDLAPGKVVEQKFEIEYLGSETVDLYVGAREADCNVWNCKDFSPVLEYRLERTQGTGGLHDAWVTYGDGRNDWRDLDPNNDINNILRSWKETHSGLTDTDKAYGKLYLRMKTSVSDINDYQNKIDKFEVIFYAEQEIGSGPSGAPYDYQE